jgi:hypothetical protein
MSTITTPGVKFIDAARVYALMNRLREYETDDHDLHGITRSYAYLLEELTSLADGSPFTGDLYRVLAQAHEVYRDECDAARHRVAGSE